MTDDQYTATIKSLAAELHRVAHARELEGDDDDRHFDRTMHLGFLMDSIPQLCLPAVLSLEAFVEELLRVAATENEKLAVNA